MAIAPTRFSRVSIGFVDSVRSIADADVGDTGTVFSVTGPTAFNAGDLTLSGSGSDLSVGGTSWLGGAVSQFAAVTGTSTVSYNGAATLQSTLTVRGASTLDGAVRMNSTLTAAGDATFTGGLFVGAATAINEVVAISTATAAVSLGAIAGNESSSVVTVALSGATRGDSIFITVDALYPVVAANRDVLWMASSSSTAGEVHVWGVNSTITSVTPTASTVVRLTRINHPSYL